MSTKRLERSERNRVIAGLFGGLGEYLNVDPNLLRLAGVVLLIVAPGVMVLLYALGVLLIPKSGGRSYLTPEVDMQVVGPVVVGALLVLIGFALIPPFPLLSVWSSEVPPSMRFRVSVSGTAGAVLVVIGLVILFDRLRKL
jgi:phage shock protein PspC (stress-responsive transcriptional regulator)